MPYASLAKPFDILGKKKKKNQKVCLARPYYNV